MIKRIFKSEFSWYKSLVHFFSIWVTFHEHSIIKRKKEKGEAISLAPLYHFHPLHKHLDISWEINAESSPYAMTKCQI